MSDTNYSMIRNELCTPDGTILRSRHRHDYVTHTDANGKTYMIDGGLDYHRRSANGDEENMCMYDDEPHEIQARVLTWGSYGKEGDQPIRWIPIADMETDHLKAVLKECNPRGVLKSCMIEELIRR